MFTGTSKNLKNLQYKTTGFNFGDNLHDFCMLLLLHQ